MTMDTRINRRNKKVFMASAVNECWTVFQLEMGGADIDTYASMWEIILKSWGIYDLSGWGVVENIPSSSSYINFDDDEDDDCMGYSDIIDVLNSNESENKWKMRFMNYLRWNGYLDIAS